PQHDAVLRRRRQHPETHSCQHRGAVTMSTITAANSVFALTITGLYPAPQILHGYAADDAFSTNAVETAETVMGLDGHLSGGFIFNPVKQTIVLMPDSASLDAFNNWSL